MATSNPCHQVAQQWNAVAGETQYPSVSSTETSNKSDHGVKILETVSLCNIFVDQKESAHIRLNVGNLATQECDGTVEKGNPR